MRESATNIRLERDKATVTLGQGYGLTVKTDGSIRIEHPTGAGLIYRSSRLENTSKTTNPFIVPEGERTESEQVIKVEDNLTLELRTSKIENQLRVDILFRVIEEGQTLFSGLVIDWVGGDWNIGFRQMDRFLSLLQKVFEM